MTEESTQDTASVLAARIRDWQDTIRAGTTMHTDPTTCAIIKSLAEAVDCIAANHSVDAVDHLRAVYDQLMAEPAPAPMALRIDDLTGQLNDTQIASIQDAVHKSAATDIGRGRTDTLCETILTPADEPPLTPNAGPGPGAPIPESSAAMQQRIAGGQPYPNEWGVPRNSNLLTMSAEEHMIRNMIHAIEAVGADPRLTHVVTLMDEAYTWLGRWIDGTHADTDHQTTWVQMVTDTHPNATPDDDSATEAAIRAAGADEFPRVSADQLTALTKSVDYIHIPGTTLTLALLHTTDEFIVVGNSASPSVENFRCDIGRKRAFEDARRKLWALEGYHLVVQRAAVKAHGG